MAANARPLWTQMPDGALKRQLLSEIAALAQLDVAQLESLWTGKPASDKGSYRRREPAAPRRARGRTLPPGRGDRALQIVLTDAQAWVRLSNDDHHILCELAAPHGPLFSWLDSQLLDHGPLPWPELAAALQGHEHEAYARELVERLHDNIESDAAELDRILQRERDERLNEEMKELSARAATDPEAYERLRALIERQKKSNTP